jgi:hypothetical protein
MPFTFLIQTDNIAIAKTAMKGMIHALDEEPEVLSDQAPGDIVQHPELPFMNSIEEWVDAAPDQMPPALPAAATQTHPAEVEPLKKRGRKPKEVAAPVADIEPSAEVLTQEEEPEAEGAVDTAEAEPAPAGITEEQLRKKIKAIMDTKGMKAATARLVEIGYKAVSQVPPSEYARVHAALGKV